MQPAALFSAVAGSLSDADITTAIQQLYRTRPGVPAATISVATHGGMVTLVGTVGSLRARQVAEHDARHVAGVQEVHNLLKVCPEPCRADADIRQAVREALARNPVLGGLDFSVNVLSGRVYLYGRVQNHVEQQQATEVAAGIAGVVALENHLSLAAVLPAGELAAGDTAAEAPPACCYNADSALAGRIHARYYWSASLHDQNVDVQVKNGRATLTGTVSTEMQRQLAVREAFELGASEVNNCLLVGPAPTR